MRSRELIGFPFELVCGACVSTWVLLFSRQLAVIRLEAAQVSRHSAGTRARFFNCQTNSLGFGWNPPRVLIFRSLEPAQGFFFSARTQAGLFVFGERSPIFGWGPPRVPGLLRDIVKGFLCVPANSLVFRWNLLLVL